MENDQFKTETVKVVSPDHDGGFAVINKSELTAEHVLFDENKSKGQPGRVKTAKFGGKSDDSDE